MLRLEQDRDRLNLGTLAFVYEEIQLCPRTVSPQNTAVSCIYLCENRNVKNPRIIPLLRPSPPPTPPPGSLLAPAWKHVCFASVPACMHPLTRYQRAHPDPRKPDLRTRCSSPALTPTMCVCAGWTRPHHGGWCADACEHRRQVSLLLEPTPALILCTPAL